MLEVHTAQELQERLHEARSRAAAVGLVATMGALHAGHAALMAEARRRDDIVVASIFVNPTQFGPGEDLDRYPRTLESDRGVAAGAGVDLLFVPTMNTMYPDGVAGQSVWIDPSALTQSLDGSRRRGHFRGVCTVVMKLLNLCQPHRAYFGQKDIQQVLIVQRMVRDLAVRTEIVTVPTAREPDGLALSSRNVYLSPSDRIEAAALWRSLAHARDAILAGTRDCGAIVEGILNIIATDAPSAEIEFVEIADASNLQQVHGTLQSDAVIALAAHFGTTRLIDNITVRFTDRAVEVR